MEEQGDCCGAWHGLAWGGASTRRLPTSKERQMICFPKSEQQFGECCLNWEATTTTTTHTPTYTHTHTQLSTHISKVDDATDKVEETRVLLIIPATH